MGLSQEQLPQLLLHFIGLASDPHICQTCLKINITFPAEGDVAKPRVYSGPNSRTQPRELFLRGSSPGFGTVGAPWCGSGLQPLGHYMAPRLNSRFKVNDSSGTAKTNSLSDCSPLHGDHWSLYLCSAFKSVKQKENQVVSFLSGMCKF